MWIMLTKKIPTHISPPRMSIFWSVPWPDDKCARQQADICEECGYDSKSCTCPDGFGATLPTDMYGPDQRDFHIIYPGHTPNWVGARKIIFHGYAVRVFPHEFNPIRPENMRAYVLGLDDGPSHELVADGVADETIISGVLDTDTKFVFDAALVDGCTASQAMATALGMDITLPDAEFPPIGWYKIKPEYGQHFCDEWEMKETPITEEKC